MFLNSIDLVAVLEVVILILNVTFISYVHYSDIERRYKDDEYRMQLLQMKRMLYEIGRNNGKS